MPSISGTKWGADRLKTDGGAVTYSLIGGDVAGFYGNDETRSVDPEGFANFNVRALFRQAFDEWSDVANIEFVEVREQGEATNYGFAADIRIVFGRIDGVGDVLGRAFLPVAVPRPIEGDIIVDSSDRSLGRDRDKLLALATHEIGHAIGLEHVDTEGVLMFPTIQRTINTPQADDIAGARQIYGRQDDRHAALRMTDRAPDLDLAAPVEDLRIIGTNDANRIGGARSAEELFGKAGDDFLLGRGGDDLLHGGAGADNLRGGAGDDTIKGGGGGDIIAGGGRADVISGDGGADRIRGGGGADTISGRSGGDLIDGGGGDDVLTGGGGADRFRSSAGEDVITDFNLRVDLLDYSLNGAVSDLSDLTLTDTERGLVIEDANGRSFILEGVSADSFSEASLIFSPFTAPTQTPPAGRSLQGGARDDLMIGTAGPDTILGGRGDDTLFGYAGDDHLDGQALATTFEEFFDQDLLTEGALQQVFGGAGNDTLENGLELYGGAGDDVLITNGSIDLSISGGRGDDTIIVVGDEHELMGDDGADMFRFLTEGPSAEINLLDFEPGVDQLAYAAGHGVESAGDLTLRNVGKGLEITDDAGGVTVLFGVKRFEFSFDDVVFEAATTEAPEAPTAPDGTAEPAVPVEPEEPDVTPSPEDGLVLSGDVGADRIVGLVGDDTIAGRAGDDTIEGGGGNDQILGEEGRDNILGGDGDDIIEGGSGDDMLEGDGGNDQLFGGEGDDFLIGGLGDDTLDAGAGRNNFDGGPGADVIVFKSTETSDFNFLGFFDLAEDRIDFSGHALINGLEDLSLAPFFGTIQLIFGDDTAEFVAPGGDVTLADITFIF